ncbi:MAG TPA: tetratricopeptide repeat protein [Acidimicrobiia bacterium]|nr:tetratricopeptide repeat protein [Acidimicrobiia bacterium]
MTAPSGLVAFLLTDIEGSSSLWELQPQGMRTALATHDRVLREAVASHAGRVFATAGDSIAAVFRQSRDAVDAALAAQAAMTGLAAEGMPVRARMAVHAGEAEERDGDFFGQALNRCGRLRDAAHGGQVIVSGIVHQHLVDDAADDIDLLDLGEHRLRDLEKPERIFQIARPGYQASFPPLGTLTRATTNFPVQLTSFVGRYRELEEVAKLIRGSRLVTLSGVGGTGKTRLAMQAAAAMADEFSNGVWLVDLAPIAEQELVEQAIADVFSVTRQGSRSLIDSVAEYLRPRQVLLLIDNCEHLLDAICGVATSLLASCKSLSVLTTSRELLRLPGEVAYHVPTLDLPRSGNPEDTSVIGRFDAVRLFVTRAESTRPGFRLTSDIAGAVLEICRRLDGIPLAIELAAAQLASFTPQQIASHLDQRFRLLGRGRRGGLPRQATLQATFDWSYALLTEAERSMFMRLSVFRGDFSLEAVQRIVAGDGLDAMDIFELLPRLIDKSLVVAERADNQMRYRLLETLRQYSADRWEPTGDRRAYEARHADYFLQVAEEEAANLGQGAKHEQSMATLAAEQDNFRQALRWALDSGEVETGLRLAGSLYRFWLYRERNPEGAWWLEAFLSRDVPVPDAVRAKALLALGTFSGSAMGGGPAGIAALREAGDLYRQLPANYRRDHAASLNNLAQLLANAGENAEAEARLEEALSMSRELGVLWGVAMQVGNLGTLAAVDGRIDQARERIDESVRVAREVGSPALLGQVLTNKAEVERDWGEPALAVGAFEEALQVGLADRAAEAAAGLAVAYLRLGQLDRAMELFMPNATTLCTDPNLSGQTHIFANLALGRAEIDLATGAIPEAVQLAAFIGRRTEGGEMRDFVPRYERLLEALELAMDPGDFAAALAQGRGMDFERARQLIARPWQGTVR